MTTIEELKQRIQELEVKENNLLLAAEYGEELLNKNTDLERENEEYKKIIDDLQKEVKYHKNV